jgi:uncharacterized protein affecting Mg2+/Co2+ transport
LYRLSNQLGNDNGNRTLKEIHLHVRHNHSGQDTISGRTFITCVQRFAFAYSISITNNGDQPVQLLRRHWIITDGNRKVEEVRGDGVVGQQPWIAPQESFHYTSGAVLETPVGTMEGSYSMQQENGDTHSKH